tara:strand:- start:907 stop:1152 length:246 start_codon:yes stop_codon:yes gene_type:complete
MITKTTKQRRALSFKVARDSMWFAISTEPDGYKRELEGESNRWYVTEHAIRDGRHHVALKNVVSGYEFPYWVDCGDLESLG